MNAEQKQKYISLASKNKIEGFVYIGRGSEANPLVDIFGNILHILNSYESFYQDGQVNSVTHKPNYNGNSNIDYWISQSDWEKFFGKPEMNISEQIQFAQSLVGKRVEIRSTYGSARITKYKILTSVAGIGNLQAREEARKVLEKNGVVVVVEGDCYVRAILPDSKETFRIIKDLPRINGHKAIDMGDYYEFGCATVSKARLIRAKKYLESEWSYAESKQDNKKVLSVTIGQGVFSLDVLNQLV